MRENVWIIKKNAYICSTIITKTSKRMKKLFVMAALCLMSMAAMAQQNLNWGQGPQVASPDVHADNSVTFNLIAPEAQKVQITGDQLASFDETASAWVVAEGEYQFIIAASAADVKATLTAPVKNQQVKAHDVLKPQTKMNLLHR